MNILIRKATLSDVPEIVRLLGDDDIARSREKYHEEIPASYYAAFEVINTDKNNHLMVAEWNGQVVGTMQLTFITYLTYQGGKRAQIEGVRVDKSVRGHGIGKDRLKLHL